MQLSCGPWSYNRFQKFEESLQEGAKPDFLDVDKDGDKKEPMKKALKEKGKNKFTKDKSDPLVAAGRKAAKEMGLKMNEGNMPPWLKDKKEDDKSDDKKAEKKDDKKSDKKEDCSCKHESFAAYMLEAGWANNPVSAEIIEKHLTEEFKQAVLDNQED